MTAEYSVERWLEENASKPPAAPDTLHPADEFPLKTWSNPPSLSDSDSESDNDNDSDDDRLQVPRANIASLVHPPTPDIMGEQPAHTHARRRSTSLAGAPGPSQKDTKKHTRQRSDHILEEEGASGSDSEGSEKTDSDDLELDDMSADGLEDDEETGLTGGDRRRRRRRKRKNTMLDQRIVPETKLTKEEEEAANQTLIRSLVINAILIGLW
jgi:solute carrier family 35 protein C2